MKRRFLFSIFLMLALCLSACASSINPTPIIAPTSTPTNVNLPVYSSIAGDTDYSSLLSTLGDPSGDSVGKEYPIAINLPKIQSAVNNAGYSVVFRYDQNLHFQVLDYTDQNHTCWFNVPKRIYDSNYFPETLVSIKEGIAHYLPDSSNGRPLDVFTKVNLSGFPTNYVCIGVMGNNPTSPNYAQLEVLLFDVSTNSIVGHMPAQFTSDENVKFIASKDRQFNIQVGDQTLNWLVMNSLTQVLPTSIPSTLTLVPSITPTKLPWAFANGLADYHYLDSIPVMKEENLNSLLNYLNKQPTHLLPKAQPATTGIPSQDPSTGEAEDNISCPPGSCAIFGTLRLSMKTDVTKGDSSFQPIILIWEIKTRTDRGWIFMWFSDTTIEKHTWYDSWLKELPKDGVFKDGLELPVTIGLSPDQARFTPQYEALLNRPNYSNIVALFTKWYETGDIDPALSQLLIRAQ